MNFPKDLYGALQQVPIRLRVHITATAKVFLYGTPSATHPEKSMITKPVTSPVTIMTNMRMTLNLWLNLA